MSTETLISELAADVEPVTPLPPPGRRALLTLVAVAATGLLAILLSDPRGHLAGALGRLPIEMAAILATGLLAVAGAFFTVVPGRSRLWLAAPLPFFAAWLMLSGAACYADLEAGGSARWRIGSSWHCLLFISATSLAMAVPLTRLLARAAPIDLGPVALLTGLGAAALATFLLHFFHPFDMTAGDIAVHVGTIALVMIVAALFRRRALGWA